MPEPNDGNVEIIPVMSKSEVWLDDGHDEISTGRKLLRSGQYADALQEFEGAYVVARKEMAATTANVAVVVLHRFVNCAYWRAAAFTKLCMWPQVEDQTYELLKLSEEHVELTSAERALIYYARGRYFLEVDSFGFDDALWCFVNALRWEGTLERALRDRVRLSRRTNSHAALYYAMRAIQVVPE